MIAYSALIIILGFICLVGIAALIARIPRIELNKEGIRYLTVLRRQTWKWSEVGPFFAWANRVRGGTFHVVRAFSDANHDLMTSHVQPRWPTSIDADISIPLQSFSLGENLSGAQKFAAILNKLREKFGAPSIDMTGTKNQADRFKRKLLYKRIIYAVIFIIVMASMIFTRKYLSD